MIMTVEERVRQIVEKRYPIPENACRVTISEMQSMRKIRYRSLMDELNKLTEQEKQALIAQWEL